MDENPKKNSGIKESSINSILNKILVTAPTTELIVTKKKDKSTPLPEVPVSTEEINCSI